MNTHIHNEHNYALSISMLISELLYQVVVRIERAGKLLSC